MPGTDPAPRRGLDNPNDGRTERQSDTAPVQASGEPLASQPGCWSWAEEPLTVAAAEQEGEAVQGRRAAGAARAWRAS